MRQLPGWCDFPYCDVVPLGHVHYAGTRGRHLGGPAGVCRGPRELPPALPGALPEICGALALDIAPAAACAISMSTAPAGPPAMLMLIRTCAWQWYTAAGAAAPVCFSRHANKTARPHGHANYTGTSVSREALKFNLTIVLFRVEN